jgi:hypothetical protein
MNKTQAWPIYIANAHVRAYGRCPSISIYITSNQNRNKYAFNCDSFQTILDKTGATLPIILQNCVILLQIPPPPLLQLFNVDCIPMNTVKAIVIRPTLTWGGRGGRTSK